MGSSRIRDQICVSCIGRQILYHWATREAGDLFSLSKFTDSINSISKSFEGPWAPGNSKKWLLGGVQITCVCMHTKSLQSCPTLCNRLDGSPPGSSVHGILQARILEWVGIPWPRDWTQVSPIAGRFFAVWATREAPGAGYSQPLSRAYLHEELMFCFWLMKISTWILLFSKEYAESPFHT